MGVMYSFFFWFVWISLNKDQAVAEIYLDFLIVDIRDSFEIKTSRGRKRKYTFFLYSQARVTLVARSVGL